MFNVLTPFNAACQVFYQKQACLNFSRRNEQKKTWPKKNKCKNDCFFTSLPITHPWLSFGDREEIETWLKSNLVFYRVFNDQTGSDLPLINGLVIRNNRTATRTDSDGKFSLTVDADVDRLVLTFVDPKRYFMTTTKVMLFMHCKFLERKMLGNIITNQIAKTNSNLFKYYGNVSVRIHYPLSILCE